MKLLHRDAAPRPRRLRMGLGDSTEALKRLIASHSVRLEASSRCQLKCPICPTAQGLNRKGAVGWGNLTLEAFERFVRSNPRIGHIELSNWGEIFLNPELNEIVKYAYHAGIKLTANNGANFNAVSNDTLKALVRYRFKRLTISIDGASSATYERYRKGGEFDRVIGNILKLNDYKRQHGSRYPILTWQFVIFGHNEHELPQARTLAGSLGMKFSPKLSAEHWGEQYSPVRNPELVKAESGLGVASVGEFRARYGREYIIPCQQLWLSPQINWDGKLLGCCENVWGDYGNVFESGLDNCLRSDKYLYAQKMLLRKAEPREGIPCINCAVFKNQALEKLLQTTWASRIARRLLHTRVERGEGKRVSAIGLLAVGINDVGRLAATRIRNFRAWLSVTRD